MALALEDQQCEGSRGQGGRSQASGGSQSLHSDGTRVPEVDDDEVVKVSIEVVHGYLKIIKIVQGSSA